MTRDEVKQLLLIMEATYPNFHVKDSVMVDAWHVQLEKDPYEPLKAALIAYNRTNTSGFAPSIGQLLDLTYELQNPQMNEMEAWGYVRARLGSSTYYAKENWESLPETIKKCVSADQLRSWATDDDFNESVAQSNFMRSYRSELERKKENAKIPENVKNLITGATQKLIRG